jgi:hypothetical protein
MSEEPEAEAMSEAPESSVSTSESGPSSRGSLVEKSSTPAKVWKYFKVYQYENLIANCKLCAQDLKWNGSTSTLTRHLQSRHPKEHKELIEKNMEILVKAQQTGMQNFVSGGGNRSDQEEKLLKWVVKAFQPYSVVEDETFRNMLRSHNRKAKPMSSKHLKTLVEEKSVIVKTCVDEMVRCEKGAITTDGWTSKANQTYLAFTFHWISEEFELHSMPIGIMAHKGTSTAEDHFAALEAEGVSHGLTWQNIVAVVTDTEPTMNATGRLIQARTAALNLEVEHVGCADHILNTTTKKCALDPENAPQPLPQEAGALKVARTLVGTFSGSSQLEDRLLTLQIGGNSRKVKLIQDVSTRWWSTYSMIERLLRVKNHINIIAQTSRVVANLNAAQWMLLEDIETILQPFMYAQKLLEGEQYVTVSFMPTIICRIRSGLDACQHRVDNSEYVATMLHKLRTSFDSEWGLGLPNTMFDEHLTLGDRNRHKGYRLMHMVAAYLDPRTKN